jgi:hypothetical protein
MWTYIFRPIIRSVIVILIESPDQLVAGRWWLAVFPGITNMKTFGR